MGARDVMPERRNMVAPRNWKVQARKPRVWR